jgi:hypothetical protein
MAAVLIVAFGALEAFVRIVGITLRPGSRSLLKTGRDTEAHDLWEECSQFGLTRRS